MRCFRRSEETVSWSTVQCGINSSWWQTDILFTTVKRASSRKMEWVIEENNELLVNNWKKWAVAFSRPHFYSSPRQISSTYNDRKVANQRKIWEPVKIGNHEQQQKLVSCATTGIWVLRTETMLDTELLATLMTIKYWTAKWSPKNNKSVWLYVEENPIH